jgi:hypothetical protein
VGFLKKHSNYLVGFIMWVLSIISVLVVPKIVSTKRNSISLNSFGKFMATLSDDQKTRLVSFEGGIVTIGGKHYLIDSSTYDEFSLRENGLIEYLPLPVISDENTRRLVMVNSILKTLPSDARDEILSRKAAIIYRNGEFVLVKARSGYSTSK